MRQHDVTVIPNKGKEETETDDTASTQEEEEQTVSAGQIAEEEGIARNNAEAHAMHTSPRMHTITPILKIVANNRAESGEERNVTFAPSHTSQTDNGQQGRRDESLNTTASTQESEEQSFHTPMVTQGAVHVDPSETWPPQHPTTVQRLDNNAPWPLRTSTPTLGQGHETGYESARQHLFSLSTPVGMQTLTLSLIHI